MDSVVSGRVGAERAEFQELVDRARYYSSLL